MLLANVVSCPKQNGQSKQVLNSEEIQNHYQNYPYKKRPKERCQERKELLVFFHKVSCSFAIGSSMLFCFAAFFVISRYIYSLSLRDFLQAMVWGPAVTGEHFGLGVGLSFCTWISANQAVLSLADVWIPNRTSGKGEAIIFWLRVIPPVFALVAWPLYGGSYDFGMLGSAVYVTIAYLLGWVVFIYR